MICKSYEIKKINFNNYSALLLYGKNEGLKNQIIAELVKNKEIASNYEEKEILDKPEIFFENLLNKSLFETEKIIIIKRSTDKIFSVLSKALDKNPKDVKIIIDADGLEKKSKLRAFFEKDKKVFVYQYILIIIKPYLKLLMNILEKKKYQSHH